VLERAHLCRVKLRLMPFLALSSSCIARRDNTLITTTATTTTTTTTTATLITTATNFSSRLGLILASYEMPNFSIVSRFRPERFRALSLTTLQQQQLLLLPVLVSTFLLQYYQGAAWQEPDGERVGHCHDDEWTKERSQRAIHEEVRVEDGTLQIGA